MADEKLFVDGMIIKRKPSAPAFVKCSLSFKCKEFTEFARKHHKDGWLNVDIKVSKNGKIYAEVDTWEPEKKGSGGDNWGSTPPQQEAHRSQFTPDNNLAPVRTDEQGPLPEEPYF